MANYLIGISPWGAILLGVVAIVVAQIGFSLLGLALGLIPIQPKEQMPSGQKMGIGASLWWGVTSLVSIFIGAWFASHLAGNIGVFNSMLHGVLAWAIFAIVSLYLVSTAIGTLIGGALSTVVSGLKSAAAAVQPAVSAKGGQAGENLRSQWPRLRDQFESLVRQTGKPELQPENVKGQAQRAGESARQQAQQPKTGDMDSLFRQIMQQAKGTTRTVDREAVANVLEQRQHMSHDQARATADQWVSQYRQTMEKTQETVQQAKEKTETVTKESLHSLGFASLWTFVLYLLSLGVASWGGWVGAIRG